MPHESPNPSEERGSQGAGIRQRAGGPVIFRPTPCAHCGYELLGLPQNGACPECGTRVGDDQPALSTRLDSPPQPKQSARAPNRVACHHCGYDLSGLVAGSQCPECGTASNVGIASKSHDTLGDASPAYLLGLAGGLVLCACGGLAHVWFQLFGASIMPTLTLLTGALGVSVLCWFGGVMLVLRQRPPSATGQDRELDAHGREWWRLRVFIGATQSCAVLAGAAEIIDILSTAAASSPFGGHGGMAGLAWGGWFVMDVVLSIAALAGLPALCYYLARLADWAPDESLARWLRHCGSFIGLGILLAGVALLARHFAPFRLLFLFFSALLLVFPLAYLGMLALMLRFAWAVRWARINTIERRERDERLAERARRRAEEMAARSARAWGQPVPPGADIDASLLARVESANAEARKSTWTEDELIAQRRASTATHTIQPSSDRSGYSVEGEGENGGDPHDKR